MDGLVGIALLVGLAVLAMPVLLVVALLSLSRLKARLAALEATVRELRLAVQDLELSASFRTLGRAQWASFAFEQEGGHLDDDLVHLLLVELGELPGALGQDLVGIVVGVERIR